MGRTLTNIKRRHYRVLHRDPAAFSVPATAADFDTFLATFTELGYCEGGSIESAIETQGKIGLDDGTRLPVGIKGTLKGTLLQSEVADYTAVETIEGVKQDILLYSEDTGMCIFYPNAILEFQESVKSGDIEKIPFTYEAENLGSKSEFRTRFQQPTA
ncbi:hypothetical protein [Caldithrix abyssi]